MPNSVTIEHILSMRRPSTRVPWHLSPDGAWLAISVQGGSRAERRSADPWFGDDGVSREVTGSRVLLINTATDDIDEPFPSAGTSWAPRWSPDGSRLAVYVQEGAGPPCLGLWSLEDRQTRLVRQASVRPFFGLEIPQWTPDSRTVILKLWPRDLSLPSPGGASIPERADPATVFSFDPAAEGVPSAPGFALERSRGDLGRVDIASGAVRRLAEGWAFTGWRVSARGDVAALKIADLDSTRQQLFYDLVVTPADGGSPRTLVEHIPQEYGTSLSWSPDGRSLAWTTAERGASGRLLVLPADGSAPPHDLSEGETTSFAQEYDGPRWSADGRLVYLVADGALWEFAIDGSRCRSFPPVAGRTVRYWIQRPLDNQLWTPDGSSVLLAIRDAESRNEGLVRLDLRDESSELLGESPRTYLAPAGMPAVEAALDGTACYLAAESAARPPELWRVAGPDFRTTRRLAVLNPALESLPMGQARLTWWRAWDAQRRYGALLLPAGYQEGQRLPLVVDVYAGSMGSSHLHAFGFGGHHVDNAQVLAGESYAVLHPDLPLTERDPLRQLPGLVLPALDQLIADGIVDPERVALYGHSYGGYSVLALLTQTDRFRCAIASAPFVNLTSVYGTLMASGDSQWLGWAESGQGRLGGTPWQRRDAYIENSPFFYLDRVRTPLLLVCGAEDIGPAQQAAEAYSALRRLGQRVELVRYDGEDHWPGHWSGASVRDLSGRVLSWLASYLRTA